MTPRERGRWAEDVACRFLRQRGLELIERNFRCKLGEIDLIMRDADTTVFIEVRYRRRGNPVSGAESVDWRKRVKLIRAAEAFLSRRGRPDAAPCRFDVVAISDDHPSGSVRWITNAFEA